MDQAIRLPLHEVERDGVSLFQTTGNWNGIGGQVGRRIKRGEEKKSCKALGRSDQIGLRTLGVLLLSAFASSEGRVVLLQWNSSLGVRGSREPSRDLRPSEINRWS
jgi:hypothetical protein